MEDLADHDWIVDTTVDDGEAWGYMHDTRYKTVSRLVHNLVDTVSKNGCFLLNVGPTPDGQIPDPAKEILRGVGDWLAVNGEAVYGTTPWTAFGEGPAQMKKRGAFSEREETRYGARDIRFTAGEDALYVTCLGWPAEPVTVASLKELYPSEIRSIGMLGCDQDVRWTATPDGLTIHPPEQRPCRLSDHACVFRVQRDFPLLRNGTGEAGHGTEKLTSGRRNDA
jgi:alpha-L-fucosidase